MSGSHRSGENRTGDGGYEPYPGQDGRSASGTGGHQAGAGGRGSGSAGYPSEPGSGGYPSSGTGGYPAVGGPSASSTGGYPTGGYPAGESSTGGYPVQGGQSAGSGRYSTTGGYPAAGSGGYPSESGGYPAETGRYSTSGGAYSSGSGRYPSGGYPSESGSYPIGDYRTGGSYETGSGSGNYPADSGGYSRRDRYESDSGDYRTGSGDYDTEAGRRSGSGGYASGSGGYASGGAGYASGSGEYASGGGGRASGSGGYRAGGSGGYRSGSGSHRVARERRGGRRGAILLAAGGAVAACALAVFVILHGVGGGSEHETGKAVGGATDSSPTASGERSEVPDSCSVVGADLINRLAPGAEQNPADNYQNNEQQNGCVWGAYAGDDKRQLTVELRAIAGTSDQTPTAVAQSTIASERGADESGKSLLGGQKLTEKSDLKGVGDEGYLVYSVDKGQGSGEAITNVRLANVLITIHYSGSDSGDPLSSKDAGDGATEAAKTVLQALDKA
ncbi:hypothetical protein [Actinomadura verrucosospora]|uniref:DUF3558 domain-containing protein n=1 Tax=Actinomadura verrucosospora TaxID=46165 RepID=A0A7D3VWF5_ACTVE|nr:hypothetical protein [Actinomadura verrucosospora]QKG24893.1 hypothetical protein ACTIVE_6544 [Actinomadura verrucosospora]